MALQVGQTLTAAQFQALQQGSSPAPAAPVQTSNGLQVGQTLTAQQFADLRAGKPVQPIQTQQTNTQSSPDLGTLDAQAVQQGTQTAETGITQAASAFSNNINDNSLGGEIKKAGDLLHGGAQAVVGVGQAVFAPITATIQGIINTSSDSPALQAVAKSPVVSSFLDAANSGASNVGSTWDKLEQTHPNFARIVSDSAGVAATAAGGEAAPEVDALEGANTVLQGAKDAGSVITKPITDTLGSMSAKATDAINAELPGLNKDSTAALNQIADDWEKPTLNPSNSFNKARAVLEKDPEAVQTLAEQKISPYTNINEQGVYDTLDEADSTRELAAKTSNSIVRPSLKIADYSVPKTPVVELRKEALDSLQNSNEIPDDVEAVQKYVNKKFDALQRKYPHGMTLVNQHDAKIAYDKKSGWNQFDTPDTGNQKQANRVLGGALRTSIEQRAPDYLQIGDVNAKIAKLYHAADYLEALNGKKAPVSILTNAIRTAAKFTGAGVAAHMGGGVFSEFAGYQIGRSVERALESLTMPMRAHFLKNLEVEEPLEYQRVRQYLKQNGHSDWTVKALPAPKAIITPAPTESSQMRGRAASILRLPLRSTASAVDSEIPTNSPKMNDINTSIQ